MTDQYSQTVDVSVKGRSRQWIGVAAFLISLGFLIASIFFNWFMMFGFGFFMIAGVLEMHLYNASIKEYIYDYSPKRLVIAGKDVVNRTRRIMNILFSDVKSFGFLEGYADDSDHICCDSPGTSDVYELIFTADGIDRRLIFAPDEYLVALISSQMERKSDASDDKNAQTIEREKAK